MAKERKIAPKEDGGNPNESSGGFPRQRELIVIARREAGLRATHEGIASVAGTDVAPLAELLASEGVTIQPLFGVTEERLQAEAASLAATGIEVPDLSVYYQVQAPDDRLDELAERLREQEHIEAAYVKPPAEPPQWLNDMAPLPQDAPPVSPNFITQQGYLDAAPGGIDARFAWTVPGGGGVGVRIIDLEWAWRFSHEDLRQNQGGVVGGTSAGNTNHGTAVIGEIGGDRNNFGITGICPDANVSAVAFSLPTATAIRLAADRLSAGDIMLLEIHRPGPRATGVGQQGYIAIEWWPDDFDAIRYAANRGVIVVEAAGNGAQNLDDPIYNVRLAGFPATWTNPFNRANRDSGAIVVGAGAPPPGTHGRNWGPDRSRLDFSNYGELIDAQGWGREVTTCGYGDLQGGANEDLWYTDQFSGTSSASPIIVGTLGCVQGARRVAGQPLLTPATARNLLRATGSLQQDGPNGPRTQRIGNRPNLRQMIGVIPQYNTVPLYRYWNAGAGDHFYTTNWNELGYGNYGWVFEGIQCHVLPQQRTGSVPLYRYWNPGITDHFYTTNWAELGAGRYGWGYEGVQCYVYPTLRAGTVPLYRYWNSGNGDHFYTTNWAELGAGRYGWVYEGIQCYVFPQPAIAPSVEGGPSTTEAPSVDEAMPDIGVSSEAPGSSSPLPSTFMMGLATSPSAPDDSSKYEKSFLPAKTEEGQSRAPRGDSFTTLGSASPAQGKVSKSSGLVTVNINVSSRANDEA